jgi:organic radical activating enzyme
MHIPKQELSFAVTEDCNLNCSYCYLHRKNSGKKMTFEIAKKAIDYFLASSDYFNVPRLIIDFIGGEPLLEIDLLDQITDYFKTEAYRLNHPWFSDYKILISTNGTLYHTKKVQEYIEKNRNCLTPSISLDGEKYLKTIDKKDVSELFQPMRRLNALLDLEATLAHHALHPGKQEVSHIPLAGIKEEIGALSLQKMKKLEEIRQKNNFPGELMARLNILEDGRVFLKYIKELNK